MNFDILILKLFLSMMVISVITREYLVFKLRKINNGLWTELGSPGFLERDYFFEKYPYRGWLRVFTLSSFFDRITLLVFAISYTAMISLLITIIWRWISY